MKYKKKLSSKQILCLGIIVIGIIIWQAVVSERVIGDMEKIKTAKSAEEIHHWLENKELKTYESIPCIPFSKIKYSQHAIQIFKGQNMRVLYILIMF